MDEGAAKKIDETIEEKPEDLLSSLRFSAQERAKNVLNFPIPVQPESSKHSKTNTKTQVLQLDEVQDLEHERHSTGPHHSFSLTPEMWQKMVEELVVKLVEKMQLDQMKQLQQKVNELTVQVQALKTEVAKQQSGNASGVAHSIGEQKVRGALKLILQKHAELKNDILLVGQDLEKLKISPKFKEHAQVRIKNMLLKKPSAKADLAMLGQIIHQVS